MRGVSIMQTLMKQFRGLESGAGIHRATAARRTLVAMPLRASAEAPSYRNQYSPFGPSGQPGSSNGRSYGTSDRSYSTSDSSSSSSQLRPETRVLSPSFGIYKGKSAMQVKIIPPTWSQTSTGSLEVTRDGVILLEFANLAPGQGSQGNFGARSYSWDKKVMFSLKAMEAALVASGADQLAAGGKGVDMMHDPAKGSADEGKVFKSFKIGSANPDGSHFFSVAQRTAGVQEETRVSVPVSFAEFHTIRNLLQFAVPRLLGYDVLFEHNVPQGQSSSPLS